MSNSMSSMSVRRPRRVQLMRTAIRKKVRVLEVVRHRRDDVLISAAMAHDHGLWWALAPRARRSVMTSARPQRAAHTSGGPRSSTATDTIRRSTRSVGAPILDGAHHSFVFSSHQSMQFPKRVAIL